VFYIPSKKVPFVTYSKNVFIPVTNICRNRCGYCGFRREPGQPGARLMKPEEAVSILENGVKAGCTEALFTFGERAEEVSGYGAMLEELGYSSTLEYVLFLCETAIDIGILPHTNAGIMTRPELKALKPLNASMGLMLESTAVLDAHENCPGKVPERRLETIREAGRLKIPYTTGLLIGIGENRDDRIESLEAIAALHMEYGHIQEVIIQNFAPKPGTAMENFPEPSVEVMMDAVALAARILPDDVAVQVAPNLIDPKALIAKGVTDLGGISPLTIDWINPEAEWPDIKDLQKKLGDIPLKERLPVYPQYVKRGWYSERIGSLIERLSDREGYRKQPGTENAEDLEK
jgi:FO synthase subunit 1